MCSCRAAKGHPRYTTSGNAFCLPLGCATIGHFLRNDKNLTHLKTFQKWVRFFGCGFLERKPKVPQRTERKCAMVPQTCAFYGFSCSLFVGGKCLAEEAYNTLLNAWYPNICTVPFGENSVGLQRAIARIICRHIQKMMLPPDTLTRPMSAFVPKYKMSRSRVGNRKRARGTRQAITKMFSPVSK